MSSRKRDESCTSIVIDWTNHVQVRITLLEGIASVLGDGAVQLEMVIFLLEHYLFLVFIRGRGCQLVLDDRHGLNQVIGFFGRIFGSCGAVFPEPSGQGASIQGSC